MTKLKIIFLLLLVISSDIIAQSDSERITQLEIQLKKIGKKRL
ncbi:hypothetical protein [Chryseobacterium camelliae]|nr:hypothetical protein [Chryseobacterium camelliae]